MWQIANSRFFAASILIVLPFFAWGQSANSRSRIVQLFEQAQQAAQTDDQSKAADFYREITAIDPTIAEVWSNLGMALYQQDRYKESVAAFERAATLKPELLAPHLFAGLAYQKMGEAAKALGPLKAALILEPNQQEATVALSDAYAQTHQFDASVLLLKRALKRDPGSESLGSNLAVTYLDWATDVGTALRRTSSIYGRLLSDRVHAANGSQSVEGDLRNTVAFAPTSVEARLALARFLIESQPTTEKLPTSEEQIEAARKLSPGNPDVTAMEIRLAIAYGDIPRATALLQVVAHDDPAFALANLDSLAEGLPGEESIRIKQQAASSITMLSSDLNSFSSKLAALEHIKSERPLNAAEDADYASAAWHLHRYEEALSELAIKHRIDAANQYWLFRTCEALGKKALEQTLTAHPDSVPSHLLLADFAIQQDNFKAARSQYEAALSLRPHDPDIKLLNVRLLETTKENQGALEEAMRGVAEFPSHGGLNFEAGELLLRSGGDAAEAAKYLERALQANPRLVRARTDLADAYAQLGKFDDSIREINQVINTDDDGTLHFRLARWYRQTGHPEDAARALELCKRIKERRIEKEAHASTGDQAK